MCVPLTTNLQVGVEGKTMIRMRRREREDALSVGVIRRTGGELDEECRLADVGGDTFKLESLEAGPAEESGVLGGEAAEELCDVFVWVVGADGLLLGRGYLGHGVLADGLVRWPMLFLALGGLSKIYQLSVPREVCGNN